MKPVERVKIEQVGSSRPVRGAWIETKSLGVSRELGTVAPRAGRVD